MHSVRSNRRAIAVAVVKAGTRRCSVASADNQNRIKRRGDGHLDGRFMAGGGSGKTCRRHHRRPRYHASPLETCA